MDKDLVRVVTMAGGWGGSRGWIQSSLSSRLYEVKSRRALGNLISSSSSMTSGEMEAQRRAETSPGFQSKSGADPDLCPTCPWLSGIARSGANRAWSDLDRGDQIDMEMKEEASVGWGPQPELNHIPLKNPENHAAPILHSHFLLPQWPPLPSPQPSRVGF